MHLKIKTCLFGAENLRTANPYRKQISAENSLPTENPLEIYDLTQNHKSFLTFPTENTPFLLSSIVQESPNLQAKYFKSS